MAAKFGFVLVVQTSQNFGPDSERTRKKKQPKPDMQEFFFKKKGPNPKGT